MDACYPFLPALLRSPFRLRDNLINSGLRTPLKALLLSGVEYGRRAANNPSRFQSSTWTRLRGAYKSRVVKDYPSPITGRLQVPCG